MKTQKITRLQRTEIAVREMSSRSLNKHAILLSETLQKQQFASSEWEETRKMLRLTLKEMDRRE